MTTFPRRRTWTATTAALCRVCQANRLQVEEHELESGVDRIKTTCYGCGQVTNREVRRA